MLVSAGLALLVVGVENKDATIWIPAIVALLVGTAMGATARVSTTRVKCDCWGQAMRAVRGDVGAA